MPHTSKIRILIPVFITIVILAVLFLRVDSQRIGETLNQSNKILLVLSPFIMVAANTMAALRWKATLLLLDYKGDFKSILRLYFANIPVAKIIPSSGGEFARAYYLKDKVPLAKHAGLIFMGIVLDMAAVAMLAALAGVIVGEITSILFGTFSLLFVVGFLYFAKKFKIGRVKAWQIKIENFFYIFKKFLSRPKLLFLIILYTFFIWFFVMIFIKTVFLAFGFNMPFLQIIAIHSVVTVISLLPVSIWGIGTRETVMLYLYSGLAPSPVILSVGLTQSVVGTIILPLIFIPLTYKTIKGIMKSK